MSDSYIVRSELIEKLAGLQGIEFAQAEAYTKTTLDGISNALCEGNRVEIRGFGCFEAKLRLPRQARNPKTGVRIMADEKSAIHFKVGKVLREALKGK